MAKDLGVGGARALAKPPPRLYRDRPDRDRDDAASASSAVLLSDIEYPVEETPLREGFQGDSFSNDDFPDDDDLPAYSDVPNLAQSASIEVPISYLVPPPLPHSQVSKDRCTTTCSFQRYSQDAAILESMIREQAAYSPNFAVRLRGTHTETFSKRDGKKEKKLITDFDIRVNMTHLLVCPNPGHARDPAPCTLASQPETRQRDDPPQTYSTPTCKYIKILDATQCGYRGTILKSAEGPETDIEVSQNLEYWCNRYVSDPHTVKTFTLRKEIAYHDTALLEALCRDLVQKTSYRGHTSISFETTHKKVVVNSPCLINQWRINVYIRWLCYLTFLWIITWPVLFFVTRRYDVVTAVFPYRLDPERNRIAKPLVQSEADFFQDWKQALTRAVLAQHQGWVDGVYREETAQMVRSGNAMMTVQSSQNTLGGLVVGAVRLTMGVPVANGWGADS